MKRTHAAAAIAGLLAGAAGCTFSAPGGGDGDDDVETLVDDTEQDFAEPSAIAGARLHPRGAIDPETFAGGGLHMSAYAQVMVQPGITWPQLEALMQATAPTGGQQAAPIDVEFGNGQPYGAGLNVSDGYTLVYRGEIRLDATTTFTLESDGPSLVQFDVDRDGSFSAQVYDDVTVSNRTVTVTPPAPGWYPIRAALSDSSGDAYIRLRTMAGPIPRDRLRSRTTMAPGLVVEGFEEPMLMVPAGIGLEQEMRRAFPMRPIWDLLLVSPNDYSARLRGQWLVETPGRYQLRAQVDGDDQVRTWLDGAVVSSKWGLGDAYEDSDPIELAAGWHDLAIDLGGMNQSGYSIEIVSAPDGVTPGVIPARSLRPVVRFGQLDAVSLGLNNTVLVDNDTTSISFPPTSLRIPPGAIVQAVDVAFDLTHTASEQVTVELVHPDGTADVLRANDPVERMVELYGARTAFAGKPFASNAVWKLMVRDNAAGNMGNITRMSAVIGYRGGPPPVAPMARFESKPRPLPAQALEIVGARTVPAAPDGATIAISLRTCATEGECAAAEWQPVTGAVAIPAAAFVEYRLELGSDGWALPTVERVEIDYRVR